MTESLREVWTGSLPFPMASLGLRPPPAERVPDPASSMTNLGDEAERWLAGESPAIERLRDRATALGREGAAVIAIHGEPGTGKSHVAEWIHRCSARAMRPTLALDAADPTTPPQLDRVLAALASNPTAAPGTVIVRVGEHTDDHVMDQLLEVLSSQAVQLVCGLVLISKRSPDSLLARSPRLADLLARAGHNILAVPPLRFRSGDVGELARVFAEDAARRHDRAIRGISPQALAKLESHDYPGNVRELRSMVEVAVLRTSGDWITGESFTSLGEDSSVRATDESSLVVRLPGSSLREIEVAALRLALSLAEGRIVRASEMLGITRHALRRKLEKFGLNDLRVYPSDGDF